MWKDKRVTIRLSQAEFEKYAALVDQLPRSYWGQRTLSRLIREALKHFYEYLCFGKDGKPKTTAEKAPAEGKPAGHAKTRYLRK